MEGIKYDGEKPEMYLLPPLATLEVGKVLTYGAKKYNPENWRKLDKLQERYASAAMRHILAHMAGEKNDDESGFSHLAHAMCCLLFKLEDEILNEKETKEEGPRELIRHQYTESPRSSEWEFTNFKKGGMWDIKYRIQHDTPSEDNR